MPDPKTKTSPSAPDTLGMALASSSIAALFLDSDLNVHWFTPATTDFLTLGSDSIGLSLQQINHEVQDDDLLEHTRSTYDDRQPRQQQVKTDGGHWCLRQVLPWENIEKERNDGVIIIYADITSIKRDAIATQNSRQQLLLLADSLPALIAYTDAELCFQFVNASYTDWLGIEPHQAQGKPMSQVLGVKAYEAMLSHCESALAGRRVNYDSKMGHQIHGTRIVHITHIPHASQSGEIIGFYTLISDITETRDKHNALIKRQEEFARDFRLASLSELAATISHQLNQPLGAIATYSAAIRRQEDALRIKDISLKIAQQARSASDVVKNLSEFFNHNHTQRIAIDMNELIRSVLTLVDNRIDTSGASVSTNLEADLPPVEGSPMQLEQIVVNLCINALEAMAGASERILTLSTQKQHDEAVLITIADTGPGISEDELAHIYEPFHSTKKSSLGMGLAICRSIAESHRGRLWVETSTDGTLFLLRLPLDGNKFS